MPERSSVLHDPVVRAALRLVRGDCVGPSRCCDDCGAPTPGRRFRLCERDRERRKRERNRTWWQDNGAEYRLSRRLEGAIAS